jgi:hypothetical protein
VLRVAPHGEISVAHELFERLARPEAATKRRRAHSAHRISKEDDFDAALSRRKLERLDSFPGGQVERSCHLHFWLRGAE